MQLPHLAFFLHKALQEPGEKTKAGSLPQLYFAMALVLKGDLAHCSRAKSQQEGTQSEGQSILEMESSEMILSQPPHIFPGQVPVRSINQHKGKYRTHVPHPAFPSGPITRVLLAEGWENSQPKGTESSTGINSLKALKCESPPPFNVNSKIIHVRIHRRGRFLI